MIRGYASSSGVLFRQVALELNRALYGIDGGSPQWERCVGSAEGSLGFAAGALFVEEHFSRQDKEEVC